MNNKRKKRFNWKSREVIETSIDDSKTKKISLDLKGVRNDDYDQCNALVIPSKKRNTKKKVQSEVVSKILSKKQRKQLEQIVDRKKKKEKRASLLDALAQVQASPEVLNNLVSITESRNSGLKGIPELLISQNNAEKEVGILKKFKRKLKVRKIFDEDIKKKAVNDPSIVGFEDTSFSSEDENSSEDAEEEKEKGKGGEEESDKADMDCQGDEENCGSVAEKKENVENPVNSQYNQTEMNAVVNEENVLKNQTDSPLSVTHEEQNKDSRDEHPSSERTESRNPVERTPAVFIPVNRPPGVQQARLQLPVTAEEQVIMEAIKENDIVVLAGETGSGKTTQLPQFLYEAGYASNGKIIGITEPRRVAAISMSKRVGYEMGLSTEQVSYLIRYEGNVTENTKIKFMTDGVLLKEVQSDFILLRYSVIILDEAHERSVYTDILLGLLSRIIPLRKKRGNPLKLVVMSATLRLEDFVENKKLFRNPPPVINVPSRQYSVSVHFNKITRENYVKEAYLKACKIHTRLPFGGILIFVTGQQEVNVLVRKLRKTFPYRDTYNKSGGGKCDDINSDGSESDEYIPKKKLKKAKKMKEIPLPVIDLDEFPVVSTCDIEEDLDISDDNRDIEEEVEDPKATRIPLWVLPLYSLLPGHKQAKVFEPPPPGCRLCVVATNVAETSLTIPNVHYVVDCGKEKRRRYDKTTGVSAFVVTWTSKASANQRAGRAGRTGPGHCYRLYSSAVFNDEFEEYSIPEMQRKPVDDLVLQMKSMGIHRVVNFPFPSPPSLDQLQASERRLTLLGALQTSDGKNEDDWAARITPLGQSMASFPVAPRFAKMLALSHQQGLLSYTICMVAALAVPEVLMDAGGNKQIAALRRSWAGTGNSLLLGDPVVLMRAVGAAEHSGFRGNLEKFCEQHSLRHKAVVEVRKLRLQLTTEINLSAPNLNLVVDPKMAPPSDDQARLLRQLLLTGLVDQVARRVDPSTINTEEDKIKWKSAYRCSELEDPVRIHSTSVLRRKSPEWVVYQEVFETNDQRLFMRGITAIEPDWLPLFALSMCNLTLPLPEFPPTYDVSSDRILCHVKGTYGRAAWALPVVQVDYPSGRDRYKHFAVFFLDGTICPKLSKYATELLSSPTNVTKIWARLQPRTEIIVKALMNVSVDSKKKLLQQWEEDPKYLLQPYLEWLPESVHNEVSELWPPL